MYVINSAGLRKLLTVNQFPDPPAHKMMFFGVRGCLPLDPEDFHFAPELRLRTSDVNYINPRCTLIQWRPGDGAAAAYPGSTVPSQHYIKKALAKNGAGANQLMTGFYADYRKGKHRPGTQTAHEAFRETGARAFRRTADDFDFENDDRVEFENPFDNLHAAWSQGLSDGYASAGCQVVIGFPSCPSRAGQPSTGPWKAFHDAAYALSGQDSFAYALLEGAHVERVAADLSKPCTARARFGSQGSLVAEIQEALKKKGFYEGRTDSEFGPRTLRGVLEFQRNAFGAGAADGIVGPQTGTALGFGSWPTV